MDYESREGCWNNKVSWTFWLRERFGQNSKFWPKKVAEGDEVWAMNLGKLGIKSKSDGAKREERRSAKIAK